MVRPFVLEQKGSYSVQRGRPPTTSTPDSDPRLLLLGQWGLSLDLPQ